MVFSVSSTSNTGAIQTPSRQSCASKYRWQILVISLIASIALLMGAAFTEDKNVQIPLLVFGGVGLPTTLSLGTFFRIKENQVIEENNNLDLLI